MGPEINTKGRDCWYKVSTDGTQAYYAQKIGTKHDIYTIAMPADKRPETITVMAVNEPIAIENLLFETGKAVILPTSRPELKRIADFVQTYGYNVRLAGHTDNIGQPTDNLLLSRARAEAVRQQLIDYGCQPQYITAEGFGETQPVADNASDEGRQKNRRVEITLLP